MLYDILLFFLRVPFKLHYFTSLSQPLPTVTIAPLFVGSVPA
jgi:hypothetical protein